MMLGFVAPRLVLLSVPKTGTSALEAALAPHAQLILRARPEIKHLTLRQYQTAIAPLLAAIPGPGFRTVAVVREPVSWLGSWYRYRTRPQLAGGRNSTAGLSFDTFVNDYLADPRPPHAALGRQAWFLRPAERQPGPDLIFRYEAMGALTRFMEDALSAPLALPRANVSPPGDLTLAPTTAARLREARAEDYALWEAALTEAP